MNKQSEEQIIRNSFNFENEKLKNDLNLWERKIIDSNEHTKNLN